MNNMETTIKFLSSDNNNDYVFLCLYGALRGWVTPMPLAISHSKLRSGCVRCFGKSRGGRSVPISLFFCWGLPFLRHQFSKELQRTSTTSIAVYDLEFNLGKCGVLGSRLEGIL